MIELREFSSEERDKLAKSGKALPDGSFPIVTIGDLKNAIHAIGRASNVDAARRHIIKRAKALGAEHLLPSEWLSANSEQFLVYGSNDALPDAVKSNYSDRCQSVFREVFNKTMANTSDESRAFGSAHAAAKNCQSGIR